MNRHYFFYTEIEAANAVNFAMVAAKLEAHVCADPKLVCVEMRRDEPFWEEDYAAFEKMCADHGITFAPDQPLFAGS